ncbi:hypothetical protein [Glutamicibacter sp. HZAU]|uniref:hypothetical protein n=1 Tax=Glutamicibacter sp. HZAU TaxID=2049891 RepID=UPI000FFC00BA|nr:hypothetical protein [Glutamicibacter sp. HZAU]RWZ83794.1 hypothetical protein EKH49_08335 [Glutamicibacter sp. HZAU]
MSESSSNSARTISRRAFLATVLASAATISSTAEVDEGTFVSSRNALRGVHKHGVAWSNEEIDLLGDLEQTSDTGGVLRQHEDAFPVTKLDDVLELPGYDESAGSWFAVTISGVSNQLQIIAPEQGRPQHTIDIPTGHNGGIGSLAWDPSERHILLTSANHVYIWEVAKPNELRKVLTIEEAEYLYGLTLDSKGTAWVGSFPTGSVFGLDIKSKSMKTTGLLAEDTEYARKIAIDDEDNIWVGTGAQKPRLFVFPSEDVEQITEINLGIEADTGFISSLHAFGSRIFVSVSGLSEQLVFHRKSHRPIRRLRRVWSRRIASNVVRSEENSVFYTVTDGSLFETDVRTLKDVELGSIPEGGFDALIAREDRVLVVQGTSSGVCITSIDLATRMPAAPYEVKLQSGSFAIQSLLGATSGEVYVGGFMGRGIASVNADTGARWTSPSEQSVVHQIEQMIEVKPSKLYLGSYGHADIVKVDLEDRDSSDSYDLLERLSRKYRQSRPFGWAANATSVFFGTVPDYGRSGGALGMISLRSDKISWVLDGDGKGFIKGHSIIGLVADEQYLYGTTSVRNGYGIADTDGPATAFKFDIEAKELVWVTKPVADTGALYSPKLLSGMLVVADIEGINIVDPADGTLLRKHHLSGIKNKYRRAGWANADLAIAAGNRLVHSSSGAATVIDFVARTKATIASKDGEFRLGSRLTSLPDGRVFGVSGDSSLAELDLKPRGVGFSARTDRQDF